MPQNPSGPTGTQASLAVAGAALTLIGRDAEVAQVLALIDGADSAGGALVVRGDAGIGKSTLLRAAINNARERGYLQLSSSGTPAEQHLPFAALHHLLGPALGATGTLAPPHRAALNHVLGYSTADSPPPPFVVALAALELLAELASERPLMVAVDDAHWLDEASLDVLLFVARRLQTERIALLLATREPEAVDGAGWTAHELRLQPLDGIAARLLLTAAHPTLPGVVVDRTLRMAAGNPLALLELPRAADTSTLEDGAPLPRALERAFAGHLGRMTPEATALLLVVAIQDGGTPADVWPVAETLTGASIPADLLDRAATAGLVAVDGDAVTFRHPLVRSAIRQAANPDLLRAAHQAWAQTLRTSDPDRYAWHRSCAVRGPDEQLAGELEAAARRSLQRGAVAAAQRWLERAAASSTDRRSRQERLLAAAEAAYELGRYPDVQRLLADVRRDVLDRSTADRLAWLEGVFDDGAPGELDGARILVTRAWAALYVGRWNDAYVAADEAYRLAMETRQPVWAAHARLGQADLEGRRGRPERALELIIDAERLAVLTARPTVLGGVEYVRGIIELGRQRPHAAYEYLRRTMDPADRAFHSVERLWLVDGFVEAAAGSGHGDDARDVLAALEPLIASVPSPGYHRAIGLARVLLADDSGIDDEITRARQAPGRTSSWFEARIDLAHGMSLRRRRRGVESRRPLSSALTVFTELGAAAWAQRAVVELAATGALAAQPERRPWSMLSAQELHIAQLAAQGLTNREIGDRLFLSHRTVGSHLYRIFPKLGITSRNQLHLVLAQSSRLDQIG